MTVTPFVRLPVVAQGGEVFAYLFDHQGAPAEDAQRMLSAVVAEFELDEIALDRTLILQAGRDLLATLDLARFPSVEVALCVPVADLDDPQVRAAVDRHRSLGVSVLASEVGPAALVESLVDLVDVVDGVVLDARVLGADQVRSLCAIAAADRLAVLVTGVSTPEQHRGFVEAGAMGSCGPHTLLASDQTSAVVHSQRLVALRLAALLSDPDYAVSALSEVVHSDAGLSLRLLRMVNSAATAQRREVTSIEAAIVAVGPRVLRDWAYLASVGSSNAHDLERALMVLVRARFCEELADLVPEVDRSQAFLAGLLAGVVDVLGAAVDTVLAEVAVPAQVVAAVADGAGPLGRVVTLAGSHGSASRTVTDTGLSQTQVMRAYLHAVSATGRAVRVTDEAREARQEAPVRRSELGRRLNVARFSRPGGQQERAS